MKAHLHMYNIYTALFATYVQGQTKVFQTN